MEPRLLGFVVGVCCLQFTVVVCRLASTGWVPVTNYGMGAGLLNAERSYLVLNG